MALSQAEFGRLVSDHGPALFRLAFRLLGDRGDAEDVVQETFRSAWRSQDHFDASRGERAWLATILRRRVVDSYRRRTLKVVSPGEQDLDSLVPRYDVHDDGYSDEMQQALGQLSPELRDTILLVVVGELTHQETADVLGTPLGTVLSRVARARTKMREYLSQLPSNSEKPLASGRRGEAK